MNNIGNYSVKTNKFFFVKETSFKSDGQLESIEAFQTTPGVDLFLPSTLMKKDQVLALVNDRGRFITRDADGRVIEIQIKTDGAQDWFETVGKRPRKVAISKSSAI